MRWASLDAGEKSYEIKLSKSLYIKLNKKSKGANLYAHSTRVEK